VLEIKKEKSNHAVVMKLVARGRERYGK